MSYAQGILVSVSSILNNSLMSKQTVGFSPTLHTTIQTITVSESIILKSKQTQRFFPTRQRNSFGIPIPKRQLEVLSDTGIFPFISIKCFRFRATAFGESKTWSPFQSILWVKAWFEVDGLIWNSFFFSLSPLFARIYSLFLLLLNLFKKTNLLFESCSL